MNLPGVFFIGAQGGKKLFPRFQRGGTAVYAVKIKRYTAQIGTGYPKRDNKG
jgi:hypothetical protein